MISRTKILLLISFTLLAVSCAREVEETNEQIQQKLLEAFIKVNYGHLTPTESGIYILEEEVGTGEAPLDDTIGVYLYYTVQDLNGTITSYNREETHKQMNDFSVKADYGPNYTILGIEMNSPGQEELVRRMKVGGKIKAVVPPSLLNISTNTTTETNNKIYSMELKEVVKDIFQYQIDSLERFAARNYPGLDSISEGFYFVKLKETENDTIAHGASIDVDYVGRFLNGKVFDTSVADTAKQYRFYSSSSTYEPMAVTTEEDEDGMSSNNNGLVLGFVKAIKQMKYGEHGIAFFWSNLGYKESGSGDIKGYTPLMFELWIGEKDEEEE